jgi:Xaa-Pro aminopeptidase
LSGFTGHDAAIIVTTGKSFFIADSRYIEEAKDSAKGFEVKRSGCSLYETIKEIAVLRKLRRIGFESMSLTYEPASRLNRIIAKSSFIPVRSLIEDLRAIKDAGEIRLIRDSIQLTRRVFGKIGAFVKPGSSEEWIAQNIEIEFLKNGAHPSFGLIVAADSNSSKPHARPTARKLARNSIIMADLGCELNGYNSDMTRMIALGKVSGRIKKIYGIVRIAQAMAIDAVRPGAKISGIDAAARQYIKSKGFGKYFGHALGHGVGLEVHEKPTVSMLSEGTLRPGMVFTVEPGIYLPKFGGVRIEDMVLVTEKGCEVLTR